MSSIESLSSNVFLGIEGIEQFHEAQPVFGRRLQNAVNQMDENWVHRFPAEHVLRTQIDRRVGVDEHEMRSKELFRLYSGDGTRNSPLSSFAGPTFSAYPSCPISS